jgi:hypothetical protein
MISPAPFDGLATQELFLFAGFFPDQSLCLTVTFCPV